MRKAFLVVALMLSLLLLPTFAGASVDYYSPDSITSFSESKPRNTGFYPDNESYGSGYVDACATNKFTLYANEAGDAISSDGDRLTWTIQGGSADSDYIYCNLPTGHYEYVEVGYSYNSSGTGATVVMYGRTLDFPSGGALTVATLDKTTDNKTKRAYFAQDTESFYFYAYSNGISCEFYLDYIRAGVATEFGWGNNGTSDFGVDGGSANNIFGDWAIENNIGNTTFWIDPTATHSTLSTSYYPFLYYNITNIDYGNPYYLHVCSSSTTYDIGPLFESGLFTYNVKDMGLSDLQYITFTFTGAGTLEGIFDIGLYGIANMTYTPYGLSGADDYITAQDGSLHFVVSGESDGASSYQMLETDLSISMDTSLYKYVGVVIDDPTPDFLFREYVGAWNYVILYGETDGEFTEGTLTDWRLVMTSGESCTVSSILFYEQRDWNLISTAPLGFKVIGWHLIATALFGIQNPLFLGSLNAFITFLGLCMVSGSSIYLVHGGREDLSGDKVFFFLVLFFVGIALFLGGILP